MSDQWKLVPVEPTEEMLAAARPAYSSNIQASNAANRDKYQRMLGAAPAQGADARPVAIYQVRENIRSDTWKDCSKDAHDHMAKYPACFETRIVYASC